MTKEYKLKDKIWYDFGEEGGNISVSNVKKFIKRLKGKINHIDGGNWRKIKEVILMEIDKLAGFEEIKAE